MANNPYVNKVQLADGTSLIDISDTTATASEILQGYTAYGADGSKLTGTATSGTSGVVYITDEIDENGGTVRNIVTDEDATITDTLDANGGTVRSIVGAEVYLQSRTVQPTESVQMVTPTGDYYALGSVNVGAIPSDYIGSAIVQRDSTDLTVSGATITAPAGVYASSASKTVASGTAGTPTATKGAVSNHSVSVTPSVTNTTGYITGSTVTGTAVTVSASELVSGTLTIDSSGTKDVTNYASASVASGVEGTPTASKGTVSNHSISVTPSVTNTAGYISGGTKTGTAVTVSASELVSGTLSVTESGTIDVTNYAEVDVDIATPLIEANKQITISGDTVITPSIIESEEVIASVADSYTTISSASRTFMTGLSLQADTKYHLTGSVRYYSGGSGSFVGDAIDIDEKFVFSGSTNTIEDILVFSGSTTMSGFSVAASTISFTFSAFNSRNNDRLYYYDMVLAEIEETAYDAMAQVTVTVSGGGGDFEVANVTFQWSSLQNDCNLMLPNLYNDPFDPFTPKVLNPAVYIYNSDISPKTVQVPIYGMTQLAETGEYGWHNFTRISGDYDEMFMGISGDCVIEISE